MATKRNTQSGSSLLWPKGEGARADRQLSNEAVRDLALETLVAGMSSYSPYQDSIRSVLYQLCRDPAVLAHRQAVLNDLLHQPVLVEAFKSMLPLLDELCLFTNPRFANETSLQKVIQRAGELQLLVDCVLVLGEAFEAVDGGEYVQRDCAGCTAMSMSSSPTRSFSGSSVPCQRFYRNCAHVLVLLWG
jgi:hypothetical protein